MKTSVRWLNTYLSPPGVDAAEAERVLTHAGFPIESSEAVGTGDTMLDVEITSNRGDCISHIGLAREIAAGTGRSLVYPATPASVISGDDPRAPEQAGAAGGIGGVVSLRNTVPDVCGLFTARVIRGVKVGPSPQWMVDALASVGQRSINNIVDITNYVMFEYGQPSHVFDLRALRGGPQKQVIVRYAHANEPLTLLDGKKIELRENELVVADGEAFGGAISLAGIMGGLGSQVTGPTTDVLLEAATWDPATIRRAARRLGIRTDASHRFERNVDPRTIDAAGRRAAGLILELGGPGATLVPGVLQAGAPRQPLTRVSMRLSRCRSIIGYDAAPEEVTRALTGHEIGVAHAGAGDTLGCTIPAHRPDLGREIDVIEEVARTLGLERVPILEKIPVRIAEPQISERASRELSRALTAHGFYEAVTFSFVSPQDAEPFCPVGLSLMNLCDERRKADPALRPSILPSLLACRRANQDGGAQARGGVRLFEVASVFAQDQATGAGATGRSARAGHRESRVLSLLADAVALSGDASIKALDVKQAAVRVVRGALESAVNTLGGASAAIDLIRGPVPAAGFDPAACAEVRLVVRSGASAGQSARIGTIGVIAPAVQKRYDLQHPVVGAEVDVGALLALFPPRTLVQMLPAFPGIHRDLSFVVPESVSWSRIDSVIGDAGLARLVGREFVTTFRGAQVGAGKKSVTVRLEFRDPGRTLRHEEVDPQISSLVSLAGERLGATLRV
ncbi:MAG: phenylalanine--tRNA ligase subunit beta [Phycisphaerales bacterium]